MASFRAGAGQSTMPAPSCPVPERAAMTVEHPCIVKNTEKAIEMVGGESALARSHASGVNAPLNLRFHPGDPTARPVVSVHNKANNILLQVTVPRRTGRKRKRGSDHPFVEDLNDLIPPKDARYLLRALQDNPNSYSLDPVATISSTHVWRSMPDFVYSSSESEFLKDIREKVLPSSYPLMKQYRFPQTYGLTNTEVIPPPQLSNQTVPTNYSYRSNPAMSIRTDPTTGEQTLYHGSKLTRTNTLTIQWDGTIPTHPSTALPPLSSESPTYQSAVTTLHSIFATRPIWTKRALINQLPSTLPLQIVRSALAHVAFNIRSGPWRDSVCLLGIDPRTDPKYRIYQTVMIQLIKKRARSDGATIDDNMDDEDDNRGWKRTEDTKSHIFTGAGDVPSDGKIWQVCDIMDPQLMSVVHLDESVIEQSCESRTRGYYPAGAWAKLKAAFKYKVDAMQRGDVEKTRESIDRFLMLPDVWDGAVPDTDVKTRGLMDGYLPPEWKGRELGWATIWRASVRSMSRDEEQLAGKGKGKEAAVGDGASEEPDLQDGDGDDDDELAEAEDDMDVEEDVSAAAGDTPNDNAAFISEVHAGQRNGLGERGTTG